MRANGHHYNKRKCSRPQSLNTWDRHIWDPCQKMLCTHCNSEDWSVRLISPENLRKTHRLVHSDIPPPPLDGSPTWITLCRNLLVFDLCSVFWTTHRKSFVHTHQAVTPVTNGRSKNPAAPLTLFCTFDVNLLLPLSRTENLTFLHLTMSQWIPCLTFQQIRHPKSL
jgi:hypothetical protein